MLTISSQVLVVAVTTMILLLLSSFTTVNAVPTQFSCITLNGQVLINGGSYQSGIEVVDTASTTCNITIVNTSTTFIQFPFSLQGNKSCVAIKNNRFADVGTDNAAATTLPMPVPGFTAVIAFFGAITNFGSIDISDNSWNTSSVVGDTFQQRPYGLSFVTFTGNVQMAANQNNFVIAGNYWKAEFPSLPAPLASITMADWKFYFSHFAGTLDTANVPLIYFANTFIVQTVAPNISTSTMLLQADAVVSNTPLQLATNVIYYSTVDCIFSSFGVLFFGDDVTTAGHSLLRAIDFNSLTMKSYLDLLTPGTQIVETVFASFNGNVIYNEAGVVNVYDWILMEFTEIDIEVHTATAMTTLLNFAGTVDLASINITATRINTGFDVLLSAITEWVVFQTSVEAVDPVIGIISVDNNLWYHKVFGGASLSRSRNSLVQFVPTTDDRIDIGLLNYDSNIFVVEINTSTVYTSSASEFFWTILPSNANGVANRFHLLTIRDNYLELFMTGAKSEHSLFANWCVVSVGRFAISNNVVRASAPGSALSLSLITDGNQIAFTDSVTVLSNNITVFRDNCFVGGPTPCDEVTAVGRPLGVSMLAFSGNSYTFAKTVGIVFNEIHIKSSNVIIDQNEHSYLYQGIQILRNNAPTLQFSNGLTVIGNLIDAEIATPAFGTAIPDGLTLNRVPIMMFQSTTIQDYTGAIILTVAGGVAISDNVINAICAPCVVSVFGVNVSDLDAGTNNLQLTSTLIMDGNEVDVAPPQFLDGDLFNDVKQNAFFVVASQIMFCMPPPHATDYRCANPILINGIVGGPATSLKRSNIAMNFDAAWQIDPTYYDPRNAKFPKNFDQNSFRISLVFAANNSFYSDLSDSFALTCDSNSLTWGDVKKDSNGFLENLGPTSIVSVFSAGSAPTTGLFTLVYPYLKIFMCQPAVDLGAPVHTMMQYIGLQNSYTDNCPPTTTTIATTTTTTTTVTIAPTTSTTTTSLTTKPNPSTTSEKSSTTTTAPPKPTGPTSTSVTTTSTTTPAPGGNNNNDGNGNADDGKLSGGATAAVVIFVLLFVGLVAGYAFMKRDLIKSKLGLGDGKGSHYRRAAGDDLQSEHTQGYGTNHADELESRRMSVASTSTAGDVHKV